MFIDKVESELGAGIFPLEMGFRPLGIYWTSTRSFVAGIGIWQIVQLRFRSKQGAGATGAAAPITQIVRRRYISHCTGFFLFCPRTKNAFQVFSVDTILTSVRNKVASIHGCPRRLMLLLAPLRVRHLSTPACTVNHWKIEVIHYDKEH